MSAPTIIIVIALAAINMGFTCLVAALLFDPCCDVSSLSQIWLPLHLN